VSNRASGVLLYKFNVLVVTNGLTSNIKRHTLTHSLIHTLLHTPRHSYQFVDLSSCELASIAWSLRTNVVEFLLPDAVSDNDFQLAEALTRVCRFYCCWKGSFTSVPSCLDTVGSTAAKASSLYVLASIICQTLLL